MKWGQSRRALKAVLRTLAFPLREMGASWCCELETGRDDFAVVEDEAVALLQVLQDIKKVTVLDPYIGPASVFVFISVYNKKPGGISLLCRLLCY